LRPGFLNNLYGILHGCLDFSSNESYKKMKALSRAR
jgi:hypothetical protein